MSKVETEKGKESGARRSSTPDNDAAKTEQPGPKRRQARIDRQYDSEQIELLLNKGLDLVETGVGLGVNVVTRLGSILKEQVIDKMVSGEVSAAAAAPAPQGAPPETPASGEATVGAPAAETDAYHLRNRATILVGRPFSLSFSINNESPDMEKKIRLGAEAFTGERHGAVIDAAAFTVSPARKSIAPMDFDKFVLKGAIPAEAPEDNYRGVIVVTGEEQYRIPVILTVSNPGGR